MKLYVFQNLSKILFGEYTQAFYMLWTQNYNHIVVLPT